MNYVRNGLTELNNELRQSTVLQPVSHSEV